MSTVYQDSHAYMIQFQSPASGVLTTTPGLYGQCTTAVGVRAQAIIVEAGGTANHANRLAWAQDVLGRRGLLDGGMDVLSKVSLDATVQASPTDANVQAAVDAAILVIIP